ncbi:hypothetical protein CAC42_4568 [Sphaceloma murrayae]|uniref:C2H2-type domain-containing protein n=1 Tax=Sphaceloma murrayae TaxID=2082308 RepID=A0A2K1QN95_9PEZI|nr:hypothetical protein CAC42_4568 [Sphaceloma murrayae]
MAQARDTTLDATASGQATRAPGGGNGPPRSPAARSSGLQSIYTIARFVGRRRAISERSRRTTQSSHDQTPISLGISQGGSQGSVPEPTPLALQWSWPPGSEDQGTSTLDFGDGLEDFQDILLSDHHGVTPTRDTTRTDQAIPKRSLLDLVDYTNNDTVFLQHVANTISKDYTGDYAAELLAFTRRLFASLGAATASPDQQDPTALMGFGDFEVNDAERAMLRRLLFRMQDNVDDFLWNDGQRLVEHIQHSMHPDLSRTWVRLIQPAIAVVWGVCWRSFSPIHEYVGDLQGHCEFCPQLPGGMNLWALEQMHSSAQVPGSAAVRVESGSRSAPAHGPLLKAAPYEAAPRYATSSEALESIQTSSTGPLPTYGPRTASRDPSHAAEPHYTLPSGTNEYALDEDQLLLLQQLSQLNTSPHYHHAQSQSQSQSQSLSPLSAHHRRSLPPVNTHFGPPPSGSSDTISSAPPATQASIFSYPPTALHINTQTHTMMNSPDSMPRDRGHSVVSNVSAAEYSATSPQTKPSPYAGSRSTPESRTDEVLSPTYKTPDRPEPPKNEQDQYICTEPGCNKFTFERKCEWSKHYDKHHRPWRCRDAGCSKLQGFTYAGGLLRHQREVHGMHGGPKEKLYCSYPECPRNRQNRGFTRKENRDEHERRVHDGPYLAGAGAGAGKGAKAAESAASPGAWSESSEAVAPKPIVGSKRKASESAASEGSDVEMLRREVRLLKRMNEELEAKVQRLERQQVVQSIPSFRPVGT